MVAKKANKDLGAKATTTFRSTDNQLKEWTDESWYRGLKSKSGKGRGTFQALVEYAVDFFLCVSPERYHAGDIERLKDYAFWLEHQTNPKDFERITGQIKGDVKKFRSEIGTDARKRKVG